MPQPFAGVRVIELGGTLAVAGSTKTFADFGADVIKVEPPTGGELRRLPPLNALRSFEAAARHESFTRAAEELCVTQGAVSHQVKAL